MEATLMNIVPSPQTGEWYFAYSSMKSNNKIVVIINEGGHSVTADTNLSSGIAYYYKPTKISKEEAYSFLKEIIPKLEEKTAHNSTDKILVEGMKRFFHSHFNEEI